MNKHQASKELQHPCARLIVQAGYNRTFNTANHRSEKIQAGTAKALIESGKYELEQETRITKAKVYKAI